MMLQPHGKLGAERISRLVPAYRRTAFRQQIQLAQAGGNLCAVKRLDQIIRSAGPHGAYGVVEAVEGSQEYNVGFRHGFVDDGCRIKAVHHRHFNIHQHQLRLNLTGAFNRLPSVRNSLDECIRAKQIAHLSAQILQTQRFVLRDQYL